jgi:hypothetical protein
MPAWVTKSSAGPCGRRPQSVGRADATGDGDERRAGTAATRRVGVGGGVGVGGAQAPTARVVQRQVRLTAPAPEAAGAPSWRRPPRAIRRRRTAGRGGAAATPVRASVAAAARRPPRHDRRPPEGGCA